MNPAALDVHGRSILIWGWGRHGGGLAAARFCAARGATVRVLDRLPAAEFGALAAEAIAQAWTWYVGDATHPCLNDAHLIVASPAIPPRAWPLGKHAPIIGPEALAFAAHTGKRIAVTGTKGKSTTAMVLGALLNWPVAGNGHEPLLDAVARQGPDTPLVAELSSFQLWYLRDAHPRFSTAVFTSLARDHLDWHPDLEHYQGAKLALAGWADVIAAAPELRGRLTAKYTATEKAAFLPEISIAGDAFISAGRVLARRSDLVLPGAHNARNVALAMAVALHHGVPPELLVERLRAVRPLPHRLQPVYHADGIVFVDDSIATTPESAIAGLAAIDGPLAVILGGSDKGAHFAELAQAVATRGARPFLIGQTAPGLAADLAAVGVTAAIYDNLEDAVRAAVTGLSDGGTVLLSPACASFDMFRGFEDRGHRFAAAAKAIRPA